MRRLIIQVLFFFVQNPFLQNFFTGRIYPSSVREYCVPTLNCYSCPAAPFSCPVGTAQYVIEYARRFPFFVTGFLMTIGTLFGSATCAYVCPFGLFQDFIYRISPIKRKVKSPVPKIFRYAKWVMLFGFVIIIPLIYHFPAFCAYVCPAGTLEAGIPLLIANEGLRHSAGMTFVWKVIFLILIIFYGMREQRPFCRFLCPLGLFLGFFNKISLLQIKVDPDHCRDCGICSASCPMGLDLPAEVNSIDCIKCGDCATPCPFHAIHREFAGVKVKSHYEHPVPMGRSKNLSCHEGHEEHEG